MLDSKIEAIEALLPRCLRTDQVRLSLRLHQVCSRRDARASELLDGLLDQARASSERRERRAASAPALSYPPDLPITQLKDEIVRAIRQHPVVILAGETGSGKTTQLPKMCLEAGRGIEGKIGCTQPRRVAALSISQRIAQELGVSWGREVGCKIRFDDRSSPDGFIKIMTDGILLAEMQGDPELNEYDTLIIDEAHERSLNIDFLLGHLRILQARRPDLKIVVTSATIDTETFSAAFNGAPVIEVSGRMFPVEVRYAPLDESPGNEDGISFIEAGVDAVEQVLYESDHGDVLVFLPGERDIREMRDLLQGRLDSSVEIVPLFGRLSADEQQRVFAPGSRRRIIVATNIAETSLTIPGIRYVIDAGLARISRYNPRTRTKRLPIEPVAQSSANQRMGRSGRVQNGICIRLYSEEDFLARPPFSQPEIQRANLAEVILRMKAFRLGEIESFPFLNPPQAQAIRTGYQLLQELGALDEANQLTPLGRELARLPVDPTVGRMILAARDEGALDEVLIIASGLSIQDPRERPLDHKEAADQAHRQFIHPQSDFLTLLNIWNLADAQWEKLRTQSAIRRFCKAHFLSYVRMREWRDIYQQVSEAVRETDASRNAKPSPALQDPDNPKARVAAEEAYYRAIHRSILAGLLGHVAQRIDRNFYRASGNREVMVFPGSSLFDKRPMEKKPAQSRPQEARTKPSASQQPEWTVAGELVETSRLYARTLAGVDPRWIVDVGRHLCRSVYVDPHWSSASGRVLARERILLHGLEVFSQKVDYGRVNPDEATEIFIRCALVEEDIEAPHRFLEENRKLKQKIETWQTRLRHHDLPDLDSAFFKFYARHLGRLSSVHELNRLVRDQLTTTPDFLCAREEDIVGNREMRLDSDAFPDRIEVGARSLDLSYAYAPGEEHDGVTIRIPAQMVHALPSAALHWSVPGLREEQLGELLRSLPKSLRRDLMPLAGTTREIAANWVPGPETFLVSLGIFIRQRYGILIPETAWQWDAVPNHLRARFEITGKEGITVVAGRDLEALRAKFQEREIPVEQRAWEKAVQKWESYDLTSWSIGDLPEQVEVADAAGIPLLGFPGLEVDDGHVNLRLFRSPGAAELATLPGMQRLGELALERELAWAQRDLRALESVKPLYVTLGPVEVLQSSAFEHLKRHLFQPPSLVPLIEANYLRMIEQARERLPGSVNKLIESTAQILRLRQELLVHKKPYPALRTDLDALVPPRFLQVYSPALLQHLPRYLKALLVRTERAALNPSKDQERARQVQPYVLAVAQLEKAAPKVLAKQKALSDLRWMVEEFKVSLFAQELGTAQPVSAKRLDRQLELARG